MGERIRKCNLCEASEFEPLAVRSDGKAVVRCRNCGHGALEFSLDDPASIYDEGYYAGEIDSETGYSAYPQTAEQGVAWAAGFVRLLSKGGRVLDIGCADGHLLKKLLLTHECFGIEMSESMSERCREAGITMIGRDLLDPQILANYAGYFDVVSAIAVFEHIPDFHAAVACAMKLLCPGGVLLFEVPLISEANPSDVWFRSSLEHIHYPSERGMRHYFQKRLELPFAAAECIIQDWGSTYVGIIGKGPERAAADASLFERVMHGPLSELQSQDERRCRCLFELIHGARPNPELIPILAELDTTEINPLLLHRIAYLWKLDSARQAAGAEQGQALKSIEESLRPLQDRLDLLQQSLALEREHATRIHSALDAAQTNSNRFWEMLEFQRGEAWHLEQSLQEGRANVARLEASLAAEGAIYNESRKVLEQERARIAQLEAALESAAAREHALNQALIAERTAANQRETVLSDLLEAEKRASARFVQELAESRRDAAALQETFTAAKIESANLNDELRENLWLREELSAERNAAERLQDQLHLQQQEYVRLKAALESKEVEMKALYEYAASQKGEVQSLKDSLSWRLSRPLRSIAAAIGIRRG
jgi:SAM-dependent methyltransferase